ncbi:MAG: SDR family NAD(P)-dependent oxidoreductase, partial [Verrucomicrobiota bacterium]
MSQAFGLPASTLFIMDLGLTNKVIIVTGGASGIGESITRGLAAEGARPVIFDRNAERGAEIAATEANIEFRQVDLMEPAAVDAAVAELERVDGVVNNAGLNDGAGLDASVDEFRASLERNLVQCFTIVRSAAASLRENQGSIINIGSKVAMTGQGGTSGYAAAKGG